METLFFYHPAVWWLSRQIRNERENCCDDVAIASVGNRVEYGRALLAVEELRADLDRALLAAEVDRCWRVSSGLPDVNQHRAWWAAAAYFVFSSSRS